MDEETLGERIARIDANVQSLMHSVPKIHKLDIDSAVNVKEHKIAISLAVILGLPVAGWIFRKLGVALF